MRTSKLSIPVLFLAAALAGPAAAQSADPNAPVSSDAAGAVAEPSPQDASAAAAAQPGYPAGGSALPERAAPPRTLRAYWHVFAAFAVTWVLLFGYALSLGRRFGRLDEEVRRLSGAAE